MSLQQDITEVFELESVVGEIYTGSIRDIQQTDLWKNGTQSTVYVYNGVNLILRHLSSSGKVTFRKSRK